VGSHGNVYRRVLRRDEPAGAGDAATLEREPASLRARLRVLLRMPGVASHPVAAHPRVSREARESVRRALLAMSADVAGRKLLEEVELDGPVSADYARDYQPLERLGLSRHMVVGSAVP